STPSPSSAPSAEKPPSKAPSTLACRKSSTGSERPPGKSSVKAARKQDVESRRKLPRYDVTMPAALTSVTHQGSLHTTPPGGFHRGSHFSPKNIFEAASLVPQMSPQGQSPIQSASGAPPLPSPAACSPACTLLAILEASQATAAQKQEPDQTGPGGTYLASIL
ncbi:hypothetical protein CYMTET_35589, partial [Cymbomonas tetramitiformis]